MERLIKSAPLIFLIFWEIIFSTRIARAIEVQYPNLPGFGVLTQNTNTLPQVFQFFFAFALWTAGIILVGSIITVGFEYMTSSANPGKQGAARRRFTGVILGACMLFGTFIILQVINPELVGFKNLTFGICGTPGLPDCPQVTGPNFGGTTSGGGTGGGSSGGGTGGSSVGFTYFCQGDTRWASQPYDGGNIGNSGCGPTSLAIIMSTFRVSCSGDACIPSVVASMVTNGQIQGMNSAGASGTSVSGSLTIPGMITDPVSISGGHPDITQMTNEFAQHPGALIIAGSQDFPCNNISGHPIGYISSCKHIFVVDGATSAGIVNVRDPASCPYVSGSSEVGPRALSSITDIKDWVFAYAIHP